MQEMFYINNPTDFKATFHEFDKNYNVVEFDDVYAFIQTVTDMLRDFLLKNSHKFYEF